jgi:hypothetical protein
LLTPKNAPFEKGGRGDLKILTEAPNPLKGAKHKRFLSLKVPFRGFRGWF